MSQPPRNPVKVSKEKRKQESRGTCAQLLMVGGCVSVGWTRCVMYELVYVNLTLTPNYEHSCHWLLVKDRRIYLP